MGSSGFRKAVISGISLLAVSVFSGQAEAQWIGFRHHHYYAPPMMEDQELSPRELTHAVRSQGFNQPSRPVYYDETAVVTAIDHGGRRVRLTLDVYSGQIVHLTPLGRVQVARPKAQIHEIARPRAEPREERPRVVQRVPDQGATIRRSVPNPETRTRATPEKPTIIERAPLLPPQPGTAVRPVPGAKPETGAAPQQPRTGQAGNPVPGATTGPVGSGTREAPRRIDIPPAPNADGGNRSPALSTTPPI